MKAYPHYDVHLSEAWRWRHHNPLEIHQRLVQLEQERDVCENAYIKMEMTKHINKLRDQYRS